MTHARIQQQGTTAYAGLFVAYDNDRNMELDSVMNAMSATPAKLPAPSSATFERIAAGLGRRLSISFVTADAGL